VERGCQRWGDRNRTADFAERGPPHPRNRGRRWQADGAANREGGADRAPADHHRRVSRRRIGDAHAFGARTLPLRPRCLSWIHSPSRPPMS